MITTGFIFFNNYKNKNKVEKSEPTMKQFLITGAADLIITPTLTISALPIFIGYQAYKGLIKMKNGIISNSSSVINLVKNKAIEILGEDLFKSLPKLDLDIFKKKISEEEKQQIRDKYYSEEFEDVDMNELINIEEENKNINKKNKKNKNYDMTFSSESFILNGK